MGCLNFAAMTIMQTGHVARIEDAATETSPHHESIYLQCLLRATLKGNNLVLTGAKFSCHVV